MTTDPITQAPVPETLMAIEAAIARLEDGDETAADALRALVAAEGRKVDNIAGLLGSWRAREEVCRNEAERLRERADRYEAKRDRLAQYVLEVMDRMGATKIEGDTWTLTKVAGRERVEIVDERAIPKRYMSEPPIPEPTPDKAALRAALKAGEVPGAKLVTGPPTLRAYR